MPKKVKAPKLAILPYSARIKVLGKFFESTGNTLLEAVMNLKPEKAMGMSVLTISKGDQSRTKILSPFRTMNLFHSSKTHRDIALKDINSLFDI